MAGNVQEIAQAGKNASRILAALATDTKDRALAAMAAALRAGAAAVLAANAQDAAAARADLAAGKLSQALYDRLLVDAGKLEGMAKGIESVMRLPDPAGQVLEKLELDEGLVLTKVSCPLGLLGIVFESRPDVVPQVMALALKSGNAVVFKGGSEAARTTAAIFDCLHAAGLAAGLPEGFAGLITTRGDVEAMLSLDQYFDLLIPRGSNALVRHIMDNTRIPVLGHADGICHLYVEASADPEMAVRLAVDSKTQYPAVCNAIETLLVDAAFAAAWLPSAVAALRAKNVELRGDERARAAVPDMLPATDADWDTEYNDLVLSVKVVDGVDDAIAFVNAHGSGHTDAIATASAQAADRFLALVDSASVMVNASTRFADGFRYGKGAEIGISTNKTHARGPVGLEGLVIYKYLLEGQGHLVADYAGKDARPFTHRRLGQ